MKNATKHAEELRALVKKLSREHKPEPRPTLEPLKALVRGSMSYDASDAKADEAMEVIGREFVDLNELRVATELEVQDMVGQRFPGIEKRVAMVTAILNAIFEKEHTLSLDRFKTLSKKDARAALRSLADNVHPFVEAYTMLFGFDAHAVPVDDMMLTYLKDHGVVEPTTTLEEAQKFLEHAVKGEEHYDVFYVLRRAALAATDGAAKKKK